MRQIMVIVPTGKGEMALAIASKFGGTNLVSFKGSNRHSERDVAVINLPNDQLDGAIDDLQKGIDDLHFTLMPMGVITLKPPEDEALDQATDVSPRSPFEIFLSGLQSLGSWKSFLAYSASAGMIVWIGLYTNTSFLLTAAMLIAPFAGPAMEFALGTARGDKSTIGRALGRYVAALATGILVAFLFSVLLKQEIATAQMTANSLLSSVSFLLPLIAGGAGALNLCQSERSSLVSGAATGMLVAASLAPPTGVIGMAAAIGEWQMVKSASFVLMLQLVGINLTGCLVFWLYGVKPQGVRFPRGRSWLRWLSLGCSTVIFAGLVYWQFATPLEFQRSSRSTQLKAEVSQIINDHALAYPVEINTRFTRANIKGQNTSLIVAYVQRKEGVDLTSDTIKEQLTKKILEQLSQKYQGVTPLVSLTVLESPD